MIPTSARSCGRPWARPYGRARVWPACVAALAVAAAFAYADVTGVHGRPAAQGADVRNLSDSPGRSTNPAIAAGTSSTMVVWEEGGWLRFAMETAGSWSPAAAVPAASGSSPALAVHGDEFHLVWSSFDLIDGNFEVLYSRFAGGSWSLPEFVAPSPEDSIEPDVAITGDGSRLVLWTETSSAGTYLYVASSRPDDAWTFGPVPGGEGFGPDVEASDDMWHLAWLADADADGRDDVAYVTRSSAGWGAVDIVGTDADTVSGPRLSVGKNGPTMMAWRTAGTRVMFSLREDAAWSVPLQVNAEHEATGAPALLAYAAAANVGWPSGRDVMVTRGAQSSWSDPNPMLTCEGMALGVDLAGESGQLHVVAECQGGGTAGDIHHRAVSLPMASTPTATAGPTATVTAGPTSTATSTATAEPMITPGPTATATAEPMITPGPTATRTTSAEWLVYLPHVERQADR